MKKKFKKIILAFIIIFAILVGIAYAYIYTDVFKTEKQLFIKYFINNAERLREFNIEPYASVFKQNQNENLQMKINVQSTPKENDEIKKINIDYDISTDLKSEKYAINFDSKIDENELLKFNIVISDEIIGIKINGIHDKYLSLKNENLKEFVKKFAVEEAELEKIPDKVDFSKQINMTDEEIEKSKNILRNNSKVFLELLEKGEYKKEKNINININNQTFLANKYSFNISEKEVKIAILTFTNSLINNQEFVNMYLSDIDSETLKEFKDKITEAIKQTTEVQEDSKIIISVYESKGNTIKTEIVMEEIEYYFSIFNNDNDSDIIISSKEKTPEEDLYYPDSENIIRIKNNVNITNGQLTIELENKYDKDDIEKLNQKAKIEYEDSYIDYSKWYKDSSQKFVINSMKNDNKNLELNMDLNNFEDIGMNGKINVKFIFGNDLKIEQLNEDNALILNGYTEEDLTKLGEELSNNIVKIMEENPNWVFSEIMQMNDLLLEKEQSSKEKIKDAIEEAISLTNADAMVSYYSSEQTIDKTEYMVNYFTIENIKQNCGYGIKELEISEDNIFKVISEDNKIYFVKVNLVENEGKISAESIEVFTEEEYNQ